MTDGHDSEVTVNTPLTTVLTEIRHEMAEGFRETRSLLGEKADKSEVMKLSASLEALRVTTTADTEKTNLAIAVLVTEKAERELTNQTLTRQKLSRREKWAVIGGTLAVAAAMATATTNVVFHH